MLFDVQAALAEILSEPRAAATTAANRANVANVAGVAAACRAIPEPAAVLSFAPSLAPPARTPDALSPSQRAPEAFPHGVSVCGRPLTWTGRVVSPDDWRRLSEWERHGSTGRLWNGITRRWERPDGGG